MNNIKKQLEQGIKINNMNLNLVRRNVEIVNDILKLIREVNPLNNIEKFKLKINNRIYDIDPNYIQYYSITGEGKFYTLKRLKQLKDFILKPVKTTRKIKIIN